MTDSNTRHLECATVNLEPDGLCIVRFLPGTVVRASEMREVIDAVNAMGTELVLTNATGVRSATREGLIAGAKDAPRGVRANAIVTGGPISVALGNMFLFVFKPPFKSRLFRDEAQAKAWLRGFRTSKSGPAPTGESSSSSEQDHLGQDDEFAALS